MKQVTRSLSETHELARAFISGLSPGVRGATVLGLTGNLGAGKTAFMQGMAAALGVQETVTSPTFVLEKIYRLEGQSFSRLVHIDAYRLEGPRELAALGWDELLESPSTLICVEWAERVETVLPENTRRLKFTFIDTETREIEIPDA